MSGKYNSLRKKWSASVWLWRQCKVNCTYKDFLPTTRRSPCNKICENPAVSNDCTVYSCYLWHSYILHTEWSAVYCFWLCVSQERTIRWYQQHWTWDLDPVTLDDLSFGHTNTFWCMKFLIMLLPAYTKRDSQCLLPFCLSLTVVPIKFCYQEVWCGRLNWYISCIFRWLNSQKEHGRHTGKHKFVLHF